MWLYNKKLCYNTFRMNHTIKHANAENHSCTVVLKRLILKEILSANFWHFTFIYTRKEGSNERINLTKKVCMQKNQFEITVLWQFKRLLRYNRPLRSTFKASQNTAFRQFNFMCLDVVRWTAHLGKMEKEETKFHNVNIFFSVLDDLRQYNAMITFLSKVRGVKKLKPLPCMFKDTLGL